MAHYIIPESRLINDRSHEDNYSIIDKTLNHLDVEDGIVFIYERVDW